MKAHYTITIAPKTFNIDVNTWVLNTVSRYFDITTNSVHSKSRKREFCIPRHFICWYLYYYSLTSTTFIGALLGNRDHASVINGKNTINDMLDTNYDSIRVHKENLDKLLLIVLERPKFDDYKSLNGMKNRYETTNKWII